MKELKRLRLKFVVINMMIVSLILAAMGVTMFTATKDNLYQQSVEYLTKVSKGELSYHIPAFGRWEEVQINLPYFSVVVDVEGETAVLTDHFGAAEDIDQLSGIITECMEQEKNLGELPDYHLRFLRSETLLGWRITFVDTSQEHHTLQTMVTSLLGIGGVTLVVFLLISWRLSLWATKPVEESWKHQRQFVSDASHELKTPLTVILSNVELLERADAPQDGRSLRWLDNIRTASGQMTELVEGLLTLARFDNQTSVKLSERFNLSELAEEEALLFEPILFEAGKELQEEIEENLFVTGDPSKLRRLMGILLDNARKYADEHSVVTLKLSSEGGKRVRLSVNTKGEVIPAEQLTRLFERFYRAEQSRTSEGYGLGLSIASGIAQEHGGKIWAESTLEDGNTFIVTIKQDK